jgi:predicted Zn-dependent protease
LTRFTPVLEQAPKMPRAHFLAGLIALDSGNRDMAEEAFQNTVRYNETHAAAWARLARLYATSGRVHMAEGALLNAARSQRGNPATLDLIGTVFRLAGNLDASLEWHTRAVAAGPHHVPFMINLANAHTYCGNPDEARRLLRECLQQEPHNAQAHWLLSRTGTAESQTHIEQMQGLADKTESDTDRAYLNYAIGKQFEDLGHWDEAFAAWTHGARARRRLVDWDEDLDVELFRVRGTRFHRRSAAHGHDAARSHAGRTPGRRIGRRAALLRVRGAAGIG